MLEKIRNSDCIYKIILIIACILAFAFPFRLTPILLPDSPSYLAGHLSEGIVPVYPLFICLNRLIFPQDIYMQIIVLEQIGIATACMVCVILFIKRNIGLNWFETYICLVFSLIPYTVFMPEGMTSGHIVTEALAYPLFYMMMMLVLKGIWNNKSACIIAADVIAIIMSLTRTQLQLTLLIPAGALFLLWMRGAASRERSVKFKRLVSGIFIACGIFAISYVACRQSNLILQRALFLSAEAADAKEKSSINGDGAQEAGNGGLSGNTEGPVSANSGNYDSQFSTVIFTKVMIAADKDDSYLFEDSGMRQLYTYIYDRLEDDGLILSSMEKNLLIGDAIQGSLVSIPGVCSGYIVAFDEENPDLAMDVNTAKGKIASALLKAHPFKWMLSGILQFPSGLISTVFVHRRNMYWISYLATIALYALAVGMCVMRRNDAKRMELMLGAIFVNLLLVAATSMVFVSLKRYVNYGAGLFYIGLYCITKEFVTGLIKKYYEKNNKDGRRRA